MKFCVLSIMHKTSKHRHREFYFQSNDCHWRHVLEYVDKIRRNNCKGFRDGVILVEVFKLMTKVNGRKDKGIKHNVSVNLLSGMVSSKGRGKKSKYQYYVTPGKDTQPISIEKEI